MAKKIWQQQRQNWLQLLRSGDERAFAEFIDKYKQTVFLCCRSLGLRQDEAEDVASETFLAAYQQLRRYSGQAQLSTWLWAIAYRQAVTYLRKNRRKWQLLAEPSEQVTDSKQGPMSAAQSSEEADIVWTVVERLPKLWAMAIILRYRQEKSIADIAKIMRVRENTAKTYLFRGRERLKKMLAATFGADIDADR
ncbi:MAG: RNA polymerase sigma factor [Sedimentisphaerales bacterium]